MQAVFLYLDNNPISDYFIKPKKNFFAIRKGKQMEEMTFEEFSREVNNIYKKNCKSTISWHRTSE